MVSIAVVAAIASTGFISLAPNLILFVFPQIGNTDPRGNAILMTGQALAAGGLLGDVFLHILSHMSHYQQEHVGLWILLGFAIFLVSDMVLRTLHSHVDHHDHHQQHDSSSSASTNSHKKDNNKNKETTANGEASSSTTTTTTRDALLNPAVVLNIAGDALHNFTDGLAIGASFATYTVTHSYQDVTFASLMTSQGGLATVSILFHEIPHELGDYCVLLKGGFTKRQAICTQFMTAIAAMMGSIMGLWVVEGYGSHSMVYLTAGRFIYLACVTLLPQVLDEHAPLQWRLIQLLAFASGLAFMYGVLLLEDHDNNDGTTAAAHNHWHGHHHQQYGESHLHSGASSHDSLTTEHEQAHHHDHEL